MAMLREEACGLIAGEGEWLEATGSAASKAAVARAVVPRKVAHVQSNHLVLATATVVAAPNAPPLSASSVPRALRQARERMRGRRRLGTRATRGTRNTSVALDMRTPHVAELALGCRLAARLRESHLDHPHRRHRCLPTCPHAQSPSSGPASFSLLLRQERLRPTFWLSFEGCRLHFCSVCPLQSMDCLVSPTPSPPPVQRQCFCNRARPAVRPEEGRQQHVVQASLLWSAAAGS